MDLFASRLNFKVSTYASWKPDPGAKYVNAFYMSWKEHYFYAFPPFSVIAPCLQKIDQDQATGRLVVPICQTPPWFTTLLHLLVDYSLRLPQSNHLLIQPHNGELHPLRKQLNLMACKLSGKVSNREMFHAKLLKSSSSLGQQERKSSISRTSHNGLTLVSAQRGQTLHILDIAYMKEAPDVVEFLLSEHIK